MPAASGVSQDGSRQAVLTSTTLLETGLIVALPTEGSVTLGRNPECRVQLPDLSVSGKHALISHESEGYVVHDLHSRNGTFVNDRQLRRPKILVNGDCLRLGPRATLRFTWMEAGERDALTRLYERALYDPLTGLTNRHELDRRLDAEIASAERDHADLAVIVVDLDHFKSLNDRHGHLAGDAVLRGAATQLRRSARGDDLVARFGGEEFVVVMRKTEKAGAIDMAERMRENVASMEQPWDVPFGGMPSLGTLKVTASLGVATWSECASRSKESFLALADQRLYRAKHLGRNRVVATE